MFTASAALYDLVYSFKNYGVETSRIAALLREHNPRCRTVLDVACGTGEHARRLVEEGFDVDGVDLNPVFVSIAEKKNPRGRFVIGDMSDFTLGRRFDAVLCLFSSIGYVQTIDRLRSAIRCFRNHLQPDGVVVVEPWLQPGVPDSSRIATATGQADDMHVTRVCRVEVDGRISRLLFDYEITDRHGTRHASEVHTLGLFTEAETRQAFYDAGFVGLEYDPVGLIGRGLYVATVAG
jgi:SAM-dependent methyltransferase